MHLRVCLCVSVWLGMGHLEWGGHTQRQDVFYNHYHISSDHDSNGSGLPAILGACICSIIAIGKNGSADSLL